VSEAGGGLQGKRALVVGGGSGIGRAVVDAFQREEATVTALELDPEKCNALTQGGVAAVAGDATRPADVERAVGSAVGPAAGLDVLVNCVGLFDYHRGLADLSDDELSDGFDEAFAVNVKSHLLSVKAALAPLRAAKGAVVLTLSTSSFRVDRGGLLYVATKYALRGVVLSLARELAPDVRVNGVAPGGTAGTELRGLRSLGLYDRKLGEEPGRIDDLRRRSTLDVALAADDIAASYVFLASPAARGMTGCFLHPDGGAGADS
jgi:NAD(P)-dependent dehydrogenase (short-subunit alcohol dehydrogenase family)